MIVVLAVFAILIFYDVRKFIRTKEPVKVFAIYACFMATSLIVSLLLAAGRKPPGPTQWIEAILNIFGVAS